MVAVIEIPSSIKPHTRERIRQVGQILATEPTSTLSNTAIEGRLARQFNVTRQEARAVLQEELSGWS